MNKEEKEIVLRILENLSSAVHSLEYAACHNVDYFNESTDLKAATNNIEKLREASS